MGDRPHPARQGRTPYPGAPALEWATLSETPLGGWGLHSGPISGRASGVTGQADSASRFHSEGHLKDRVLLLLGEHLQTLGSPSPEGRVWPRVTSPSPDQPLSWFCHLGGFWSLGKKQILKSPCSVVAVGFVAIGARTSAVGEWWWGSLPSRGSVEDHQPEGPSLLGQSWPF